MKVAFAAIGFVVLASAVVAEDRLVRVETYDVSKVVTLFAKRGVTTHIQLDPSEHIEFVSTGVGSNCERPTDTWCVVAPNHGSQLFIKPKSATTGANNIAIATDKRAYSLRLVMLADNAPQEPLYRLTFRYLEEGAEQDDAAASATRLPPLSEENIETLIALEGSTKTEVVKGRLKSAPKVINSTYSMKVGKNATDIAPVMIFDDGRFTYFKYPNNREVPAVFAVSDEGKESVVNVHMEMDPVTGRKDLLCADVVARRFFLRRGSAVVGIWNDAFDVDGLPPVDGTTVPGVARLLRNGE